MPFVETNIDVPVVFLLRQISKAMGTMHKTEVKKMISDIQNDPAIHTGPVDKMFFDLSRLQDMIDNISDVVSETPSVKIDIEEYGIQKEDYRWFKKELNKAIQEDEQ